MAEPVIKASSSLVAERTVWLRNVANENRDKPPPSSSSSIISTKVEVATAATGYSGSTRNKVSSIQERVQLFESMSRSAASAASTSPTSAATTTTTPDRRVSYYGRQSNNFHTQLTSLSPSTTATATTNNELIELISSHDSTSTNTTTATTSSTYSASSFKDLVNVPEQQQQQNQKQTVLTQSPSLPMSTTFKLLEPSKPESDPEPLIGLPVTSSVVLGSKSTVITGKNCNDATMVTTATHQQLDNTTDTNVDIMATNEDYDNDDDNNIMMTNDSFDEIESDSDDDDNRRDGDSSDDNDNDQHILKIVKVIHKTPLLKKRLGGNKSSYPWDERENNGFSVPYWLSSPLKSSTSMTNTNLPLVLGDDSDKQQKQQTEQRLPTTRLNPKLLRNRTTNCHPYHPKVQQQPRNFVFVDDDEDDSEEDDIETVIDSIAYDFSNSAIPRNNEHQHHQLTTSSSFDSIFSSSNKMNSNGNSNKEGVDISPLQPPRISRYATANTAASDSEDITTLLNLDWVEIPTKVKSVGGGNGNGIKNVDTATSLTTAKADHHSYNTIRSDKAMTTTRIPILEIQKDPILERQKNRASSSALPSAKDDHPLLSGGVFSTNNKRHEADGLWFTATYENDFYENEVDGISNSNARPTSTVFPPSALDLPRDIRNRNKYTRAALSKDNNPKPNYLPTPFGVYHHNILPVMDNRNRNLTVNRFGISSPTFGTDATLSNVFTEEAAAEDDVIKYTDHFSSRVVPSSVVTSSNGTDTTTISDASGKSVYSSRQRSTLSTSGSTIASTNIGNSKQFRSNRSTTQRQFEDPLSESVPLRSQGRQSSDRITATITQLCQSNKNSKFQKKSLVQMRQEQLASNLGKNRIKNRISKGSWQKDSSGNFRRHFTLVDDNQR